MNRCPNCDHFNLPDLAACERCGTPMPAVKERSDAAEPGPSQTAIPQSADEFVTAVLQTARDRGKIAAIKLYRERRGVGLKQAKDDVEALLEQHGVRPGAATGSGCGTTALFAAVLLAGFLILRATL